MLARAERGYALSTPQPGWAEQDPEDWWRAAQAALAELAVEPTAIGLSGPDARTRRARRAATACCAPRSSGTTSAPAAECAEIEEPIGLERLIALTGNRALTGFTAPKLLWLRRHEPETYAQIRHVLLPKDYVRLRLTGERAIDAADASGTLLFDVAGRRWSDEVLDALELPREWLPPGRTSRRRSAAAGDQAAGALGVGVDRPGPALGRPRHVGRRLRRAARVPPRARGAAAHVLPRRARHVARDGRDALRRGLARLAARGTRRRALRRAPRGSRALGARHRRAALPALPRGRADAARRPRRAWRLRRALASPRPRRAVRAVLEGVAYGLRDSLELLRALGVEATSARVSGGGARSELWLRIVASVLGLPLERTAVEEGAAYGAALLGGVAAGEFADAHEAVASCVRVREPDRAGARVAGGLRGGLRRLQEPLPRAPPRG